MFSGFAELSHLVQTLPLPTELDELQARGSASLPNYLFVYLLPLSTAQILGSQKLCLRGWALVIGSRVYCLAVTATGSSSFPKFLSQSFACLAQFYELLQSQSYFIFHQPFSSVEFPPDIPPLLPLFLAWLSEAQISRYIAFLGHMRTWCLILGIKKWEKDIRMSIIYHLWNHPLAYTLFSSTVFRIAWPAGIMNPAN